MLSVYMCEDVFVVVLQHCSVTLINAPHVLSTVSNGAQFTALPHPPAMV